MIITKKITSFEDYKKVIFYDLEGLKDEFISKDKKYFDYHFKLLKGNLKDFFKIQTTLQEEIKKEMKAIEKEDKEMLDPDIDISELTSDEAYNRGYYRALSSILEKLKN